MTNLLFVNFKNYAQAFEGFPKIYQDLEAVAQKYPKVTTVFAPPPLLFAKVAETVKISLWAQHLDPVPLGKFTGFLPAEALTKVGARGTLLNHSEHPLDDKELGEAVRMAKSVGLKTLIFGATPEAIYKIKDLNPDYVAYEPPELIGGDVSVTSARAEIIPEAVKAAKPIPLLVGAGIHKGEDIKTALKLGSVGGGVSSAIAAASQPAEVLDELLSAF